MTLGKGIAIGAPWIAVVAVAVFTGTYSEGGVVLVVTAIMAFLGSVIIALSTSDL